MENSQNLVAPELDKMVLGVLVGLLRVVQTLEHLRDISHIEEVVGVGRRGQELLLNLVEQLNGCHGEGFTKSFDLLREVVEFEGS